MTMRYGQMRVPPVADMEVLDRELGDPDAAPEMLWREAALLRNLELPREALYCLIVGDMGLNDIFRRWGA